MSYKEIKNDLAMVGKYLRRREDFLLQICNKVEGFAAEKVLDPDLEWIPSCSIGNLLESLMAGCDGVSVSVFDQKGGLIKVQKISLTSALKYASEKASMQFQASLDDQLRELQSIANKYGLQSAADYVFAVASQRGG